MRLEGRVAIVTGGAGSIGRAIARRLDDEGATVVVADLRAGAAEETAAGLRHGVAQPLDVSSSSEWNDAVARIVAANDLEGLLFVQKRVDLPVIADESCVVRSDLPLLEGRVAGINIKLSKCGGIREALKMIAVARTHDMLTGDLTMPWTGAEP